MKMVKQVALIVLMIVLIQPNSILNAQSTLPEGMVLVKGGVFQMGDIIGFCDDDEYPIRKVQVSDFYMDEKEARVAEYRKFCRGNRPGNATSTPMGLGR